MSKLNYPDRIFSLSDCHGGQVAWNPIKSPDIAARLAESIRSDLSGVQRFDTFGIPERFHDHIVREALRLHREQPQADRTGLFINNAPRTEAGKNGEPFFRAEFDEDIVIVGTPIGAVSAVRGRVKKLLIWPNEGNGTYDHRQQHRSAWAPKLLADNHGFDLEEVDFTLIPELPEGCWLDSVDRFGGLGLFENVTPEIQSIRAQVTENVGSTFRLRIGPYACDVTIGTSLPEAEAGQLVIYPNDDGIEVRRKWEKDEKLDKRIKSSAYSQFGKPQIGDECAVVDVEVELAEQLEKARKEEADYRRRFPTLQHNR